MCFSSFSRSCSLDVYQPAGFRVALTGGLFHSHFVFHDVVQALADLDEPDAFVARNAGAQDPRLAALAVIALAVMYSWTLRQ